MNRSILDNALIALAGYFEHQAARISDRVLNDATDYRVTVVNLNELAAGIYAADLALSHAYPGNSTRLRDIAANTLAFAATLLDEAAFLDALQDEPEPEGAV